MDIKTFNFFFNLAIFFLTFIIGLIVLFRSNKKRPSVYLGLFLLSTSLWIACLLLADNISNIQIVEWAIRLAVIGPSLLSPIFLLFTYVFLKNESQLSLYKKLLIFFPAFLIIALSPTHYNVKSVSIETWGANLDPGPMYYALFAYMITCFGIAAYRMRVLYTKTSQVVEKQQIKIILIGALSALLFGISTNLVSVLMGVAYLGNYGPIAGLILSTSMMIVISKHKLLNIKLLLSESLVYLVVAVLIIEIFFSRNSVEVVFRLLFLIIIGYAGYFSIRLMANEVKQKEKIESLATELKDANTHLKELDKVKDDFLSMASHELNTPISAIEGYLSMILDEGLGGEIPPKAKTYLESVFKSSKRLANLVKDLLNVSRIESGRIHLIYAETQITDIIDQAVMEIAPKVKEANHTLTFHKPTTPPPKTWFDVTRITEILINMLGNSCKYTPPGGKIDIRLWHDDSKIVVGVIDNGKGIPKEAQDKVFQKFSQVDVLKDEVKGTGLGMYIAQKLIKLHNGQIWFESEGTGKGTQFYFSLPILKSKPADPHEGEGPVLH